MSRLGVAFVVACFVAVVLVIAWIIGEPRYKVPADVRPMRTVTPMTPQEIWGQ